MIKRTDSENSGISVFPSTKKLSVQVSLNGLSFSVLDAEASRLVTAGTHWFPRTASEDTLQDQVTAAMEQFDLISPSFDRIQLIYQSDRFALVPAPFLSLQTSRIISSSMPDSNPICGPVMKAWHTIKLSMFT